MIKLLVIGIICVVLSGCTSPRYSDRTLTNFHEAKTRLSQLREGMKRAEVEAILKPLPLQAASDWDNTGYLPVSYRLYPGIWVHVDYLAPRYVLLRLPTSLEVALNNKDKPTREFEEISLDQIR